MKQAFNKLANLQLLQGTVNVEKNDMHLNKFLEEKLTDAERKSFLTSHYFPDSITIDFVNFLQFYKLRKNILKDKLSTILKVEQPKVVK